jgi:BirA family transcriptional regulator, biotin operon repressor / biotin---[acetyl-CoA-carboxylase] ligase
MRLDESPERWIRLDVVDSTNTYLLEGDFPSGAVAVAREQTAGRGRRGKAWSGRTGDSFYFSGLLGFDAAQLSPARLRFFPLLAGVSVLAAVREVRRDLAHRYGPRDDDDFVISVKWPNDVYLSREGVTGKLAGALVESRAQPGDRMRVVVGIGLNWSGPAPVVTDREPGLPGPISLFPDGAPVDPLYFTSFLTPELNRRLQELASEERPSFLQELRAANYLKGRVLRTRSYGACVGQDIGEDGALLVERVDTGALASISDADEALDIDH